MLVKETCEGGGHKAEDQKGKPGYAELAKDSKGHSSHVSTWESFPERARTSSRGDWIQRLRASVCHVIAQLQAPNGTFPTSTVPRPENKPGVTGSECEKGMFGV